jgi:anti-anti-sigma factor
MEVIALQEGGLLRLRAGSEWTIYTAAEVKAELNKHWPDAGEIELNLSRVDELDCAGVQLLLQLKSDSEQASKPVRFTEHSPVVIEVLELMNLIGRFSDPVVLSAGKVEVS